MVVDVSDECLLGEDEKHLKGMFELFKLTEFPKNAVQTPNPLILSCRCSDFCFCANVITKAALNPRLWIEYTRCIREEKHGLDGGGLNAAGLPYINS